MMRNRFDIETTLSDVISGRASTGDNVREVPIRRKVFVRFLTLSVLLAAAVLVRVLYIGVVRSSFYSGRAIRNMSDVSVLPAPRGIILDRFGKPLVRNDPSFNVTLHPQYLPRGAEARALVISEIASVIRVSSSTLTDEIARRNWNTSDRMVLKEGLNQDELVAFASSRMPGVTVEPGFERALLEPLAFSHLIGYTGLVGDADLATDPSLVIDDGVGRAGLEAFYDRDLRGKNGEEVTYRDAKGSVLDVRMTRTSESGASLKTFIDADLQVYMYRRLSQALTELGRDTAIGIALDPRNGEVLAMVGIPGYDPLHLTDYLEQKNQPLFNRAVSGRYNPGSTIKPLVATAALTEGVIKPETQIYSKGYIDVPNPYHPESPSRFVDWRPQGWVNVIDALARSSNVYFYEVGGGFENQPGLGITKLKLWWEKFNFDKPTGIDLAGEVSGFLPDPAWKEERTGEPWRLGDTYHVSIGQGDLTVTPIRLISYISAIANGGKMYVPRIAAVTGGAPTTPVLEGDLSSQIGPALAYVHAGMRAGVTKPYGTSHILGDLPVAVAAKTGSAQVENNAKTNAFFVGYAPVDNPQIAILILIENSREGSSNTIPVARDVFLWYHEHRLKPGS